ncbi:MAG TPA: CopD family protein [Longimicrobiales bacterium]|nr:CopD family protein [Longimicrobiales bacterium]
MGISAVRGLTRHTSPGRGSRLAVMGAALAAVAVVALGILGWAQLAAFRDPFAPWQEDAALLLGSAWGTRWTGAAALAAATLVAFAVPRLRPAAFVLPLGLAAYPALSGHAAASGDWTGAAVVADWVHVLAAGTWMGALTIFLLAGRDPSSNRVLLVRHLDAFSLLARGSVAALVLTGAFASWLHLPAVDSLWTHPYGRVLALKLLLVAGLLALGAYNWRVRSPRAGTEAGARSLVASARLEAVAGGVVLVVTAWLTGMAPPP